MRNRYNLTEWAGALGDLGTFIPFVVGYLTVTKMEPTGVLFSFGVLLVLTGLYYKTPIPVQPMKAIGGAAITGAASITPGVIWGAGLFTGAFWLLMGLTGITAVVAKLSSKPVMRGIVLGLGFAFMLEGLRMMKSDLLVALPAFLLTFFLLANKRFPAMFALIIFGLTLSLIRQPELLTSFSLKLDFKLPQFALVQISWSDIVNGAILLGIPQIPLTLGNAIIALTAENNRLFPERAVNEQKIAISHGIMNLFSPIFGGIPICHGAGGLAGHVRFGARTGGAPVILGTLLIILALCFGSSIIELLHFFPASVLGVILFFAGLELAVSIRDLGNKKSDYYVLLVTAGFGVWNMGAGFLAGVILDQLLKKEIIRV